MSKAQIHADVDQYLELTETAARRLEEAAGGLPGTPSQNLTRFLEWRDRRRALRRLEALDKTLDKLHADVTRLAGIVRQSR